MLNQQNEMSKKERRALKRAETEQARAQGTKQKTQKRYGIIAVTTLALVGGGYWWWNYGPRPSATEYDPLTACVSHQGASRMHWHPHLTIRMDGEEQEIPTNVGIPSLTCLRPLHTHDANGTIHVESPVVRNFTLGEFFRIWDKPFDRNHLLDRTVDAEHRIVMKVDGQPSEEYEALVFKDGQRIELSYERINDQ